MKGERQGKNIFKKKISSNNWNSQKTHVKSKICNWLHLYAIIQSIDINNKNWYQYAKLP